LLFLRSTSAGATTATLPRGLKALKRESRQKLDAYQHLFYRLQTCPEYLAKLIFALPQSSSNKFLVIVTLTFLLMLVLMAFVV
jgi:5-methylcytosine-specific restriction endonuclease McrBC regulatory subunit McrC